MAEDHHFSTFMYKNHDEFSSQITKYLLKLNIKFYLFTYILSYKAFHLPFPLPGLFFRGGGDIKVPPPPNPLLCMFLFKNYFTVKLYDLLLRWL